MSNLYNLEPQPTAKVVLHTTAGDLSLELFAKQTPLASRNFLQHCLDGYYNNTIFHRLVPSFIVQGGDPTGTGSGGISAINDGDPFKDEFHSRLKFNRRGLLGMANEGADNNASQFFLTLGVTPELQGKHTMFGRIEGDTIYNLMKIGDGDLVEGEGSDRPLYPVRFLGADVLVNPFEDMVVRVKQAPRTEDGGRKEAKKRKKPASKNVLSFGADEGEDDTATPVFKKAKANPKFISITEDTYEGVKDATVSKAPPKKKSESVLREKGPAQEEEEEVVLRAAKVVSKVPSLPEPDLEDNEPEPLAKTNKHLEKTNAEIAALKASMKRSVNTVTKATEKPKSALEAMIPATSTRGRKRGKPTDEKGALELFKAFKSRLEDLPTGMEVSPPLTSHNHIIASNPQSTNGHDPVPATTEDAEDQEAELCDLHFIANCQSCRSWDEEKPDGEAEVDGDDDAAWMSHTLSFARDTLGKDLEWKKKMEEIEVIDPREKARTIKEEMRRDKGKGKEKKRL